MKDASGKRQCFDGELALDHVLDYFKGLDKRHNIDISSERSPLVPRHPTVVRPESLQVL